MPRSLALALALAGAAALTGCATAPHELCGTWVSGDQTERWWVEGRSLRGEGTRLDAGVAVVTERLYLRPSRGGTVYVATPTGAAATEFDAIPASAARFGPREPPGARHLVWANYAHDFPQEIHYLVSPDQLRAVVSGPGRETGWTFTRAGACPTAPP